MEHNQAFIIASNIQSVLKDLCDKIDIAGSVRRHKKEVKDIELVAIIPAQNRMAMMKILEKICYRVKGMITGRYMQWQDKQTGIKIDLFLPQAFDYYRIFAIRTGSADFSAKHIAGSWVRKGWVGTEFGLRLKSQCIQTTSKKWKPYVYDAVKPPVWKSEEDFFEWLGLKWISPEKREVL